MLPITSSNMADKDVPQVIMWVEENCELSAQIVFQKN
jgi:hypothetical protein